MVLLLGLFLYAGITKLLNPAFPAEMLTNLGFPASNFLAWVLLLSEILFGFAILLGWKLKYTVWPLVIILVVAVFKVSIPSAQGNYISVLFHILGIMALLSLYFTGPGKIAAE